MSTTRTAPPGALAGALPQGWGPALLVLLASFAALGVLFATEAATAVETWDRSTAYNHCWLVLPIAAWLAWQRRARLAGLVPEPTALFAIPALGAALAWLAAERLGIMEGRQLAALALAVLAALSVLGWRIGLAMAAPLAYLVFLVPFGAFAVPALQRVTAWMIVAGLQLLGITHYADDLIIEIPSGTFLVAEACAGLRFAIASLAFGALYALVMFRSPGRRLLVLVLAIVVPILANGLRALGIVVLGHHLGSAEAAAADHLIYGWVFFSAVLLALVLLGLPFRQDTARPEPAPQRIRTGETAGPPRAAILLGVAALQLAVAGAAPALVAGLGPEEGGRPVAVPAALTAPEGCSGLPSGELACQGLVLSARLLVFSPRVTWSAVTAEGNRVAGEDDEALTFSVRAGDATWRGRQSPDGTRLVAVAAWLHGVPAGGGFRSRAEQGWNSLGGGSRPVLAVVTVRDQGRGPRDTASRLRDRTLLRQVLEGQGGGLAARAAELSREP
ncbi:exosortase A [Pararoseomonas sp. SCSIO 73927]|uniref:exosortase A n=1 Tax=Pararoseomonas sp. SCSIO 73927 TaxID=3114537 RepID=UPI0030CFDA07